MMLKFYRKREKQILKHWFPNHEVTHFCEHDHMSHVRWAKPGTGIYQVDYYASGNRLMITGDIGAAVYVWSSPVTFHWLADLELSYFAGKCIASETGREYTEWDDEVAKTVLDSVVKDTMEGYQEHAPEAGVQWRQDLQNANPWGILHSEQEWVEWLHFHGHQFFGDDFYEMASLGRVINMRCQGHLLGLRLAHEWRVKNG